MDSSLTLRLRLDLELTHYQVDNMINQAIKEGFLRVEPKKPWTDKERKEAVRYALKNVIGRRSLMFD